MAAHPTTTTDADLLAATVPAARTTEVATVIEVLEAHEIPTMTTADMDAVRPDAVRPWRITVRPAAEEDTMIPTDETMDPPSHTLMVEADLRTSALRTMDPLVITRHAIAALVHATVVTLAAVKITAEAAEGVVVDTGNSFFHILLRGSSLTLSRSISALISDMKARENQQQQHN